MQNRFLINFILGSKTPNYHKSKMAAVFIQNNSRSICLNFICTPPSHTHTPHTQTHNPKTMIMLHIAIKHNVVYSKMKQKDDEEPCADVRESILTCARPCTYTATSVTGSDRLAVAPSLLDKKKCAEFSSHSLPSAGPSCIKIFTWVV